MMRTFLSLVLLVTLLAPVTHAESPYPERTEPESLAPLPVKAQPVVSTSAVASPTTPVSPSLPLTLVKGVTVTLSGTTGFARDAALDVAARQALPTVLERLPMDAKTATLTAKSVGDPQKFVQSYAIIKETILPSYRLVVDLTYNESLLRKNFGGKITKIVTPTTPLTQTTSGTSVSTTALAPAVPLPTPTPVLNRFTVLISTEDPAETQRLVTQLSAQTGTTVLYSMLTAAATELQIQTPMAQPELQTLVGTRATVTLPDVITAAPLSTISSSVPISATQP